MTAARAAEAASVGLILTDQAGRIEFVNGSAETLLRQSRNRLIGMHLRDTGAIGAAVTSLAERARLERRQVVAHDLPIGTDAGLTRLSVDAAPEGRGVCLCLRLWPESSASPSGLTAANAAVGFGRLLSHELKNPIAGARGAAQLIADAEGGETAELASLIIVELDRARRIAERWSRIGDLAAGDMASVNLHALVRAAVRSAAAAGGEAVIWNERFDPSLPDALADHDLALQAVLNLLTNAAEALGQGGGEVTISTRYRSARPGGPAPEARLEVRVEDDGPGIPEALQTAVFNPFVTGKPAGEGLGLSLVARIAELHGGGVEFESEPGRTCFHLYFREVRP